MPQWVFGQLPGGVAFLGERHICSNSWKELTTWFFGGCLFGVSSIWKVCCFFSFGKGGVFSRGRALGFLIRSCALQEMIFCQGLVSDAPLECNQTCNIHVTISFNTWSYLPTMHWSQVHQNSLFVGVSSLRCCSKGPRVKVFKFRFVAGIAALAKQFPQQMSRIKPRHSRGLSQKKRRRKRAS